MLYALIAGLILILLLSAFFSGSETALMSLDRYRLRHLERSHPVATKVRAVVSHPEKVLGTILTGNVFVNTAGSALITYAVTLLVTAENARAQAVTAATLLLTALILVFGEMVPKSFAARHPETWSFFVIRPISFLIRLLGPAVRLLAFIAETSLRLVGERSGPLRSHVSLEEIRAILYSGTDPEGERGSRREMMLNVIELSERRVGEVMVSRMELVAVPIEASLDDVVQLIQKHRFSRMPVYRDRLDNIVGLIYAKDVMTYWGERVPFRLEQVLRKPYFVPDTAKVEQALEQMQQHRMHMAMVVDEHGGVEGIVTIEDLLEEIVGELMDEGEEDAPEVRALADGSYSLDGAASVKLLNEQLGLELPETADYNTIAGFILERLGRIPSVGEEVSVGGIVFSVERVVNRRVMRVRARRERA